MDKQLLEQLTEGFRQALQDFFNLRGYHENAGVQQYSTQLLWNTLELQKRRLDNKGLKLDFQALRKQYTQAGPLQWQSFFDGKYEITAATEEIEATRLYSYEGVQQYKKLSNQLACYTILNAQEQGENSIVCPNCGHTTTRENLLDGCDYCHSRFTVEDLGSRIASFATRADFDIINSKYQNTKDETSRWISLVAAALGATLGFVLSILVLPFLDLGFLTKLGMGLLVILGLGFVASTMAESFFNGFLGTRDMNEDKFVSSFQQGKINLVEAIAYGLYVNGEMTESMRKEDCVSPQTAKLVRQFDPLFSLNGFLSNVQNKLAVILFAENRAQINALANCELERLLDSYRDVFEMDVEEIQLMGYRQEQGLQRATVAAKLKLVLFNEQHHIILREDAVKLTLVKDVACKTQAIRGPEVLVCKCCGAALNLLQGKACSYCGQELQLEKYDWTVAGFELCESKVLETRV